MTPYHQNNTQYVLLVQSQEELFEDISLVQVPPVVTDINSMSQQEDQRYTVPQGSRALTQICSSLEPHGAWVSPALLSDAPRDHLCPGQGVIHQLPYWCLGQHLLPTSSTSCWLLVWGQPQFKKLCLPLLTAPARVLPLLQCLWYCGSPSVLSSTHVVFSHPDPSILHHSCCTLHPAFVTLHPVLCILHLASCILAPCILQSASCIQHPALCILHATSHFPYPHPSSCIL